MCLVHACALLLLLPTHWMLQEEKVVAHLLAGASFGELALMQVAIKPEADVIACLAEACLLTHCWHQNPAS